MGVHRNIGIDNFPVQSDELGKPVGVMVNGEPEMGVIVRDDLVDPLRTVIELSDGSVVLGDERDSYTDVEQARYLGRSARVCFRYDASRMLGGIIVRDDAEDPYHTIIKLETGRFVLATECQYSPF